MKKIISKPHPNIFAWIEFIQREESITKAKIQSYRTGATYLSSKKTRKGYRLFLIALMLET